MEGEKSSRFVKSLLFWCENILALNEEMTLMIMLPLINNNSFSGFNQSVAFGRVKQTMLNT